MEKILIAEISGKRPGDERQRKTERFHTKYDHVIISNNSEGYNSKWPIIDVPEDYRQWYVDNVKTSENAWYAPMNRSYAIKYAREHGYRYLVQLDDNIKFLEIGYYDEVDGVRKRYRTQSTLEMLDDFVDILVEVLKNTNAGIAGCGMSGVSNREIKFLVERYVYSFFALDLAICPDIYQGDFEDDIEYRLKMAQMGFPSVQVPVLKYSKTGQSRNKDLTGNRKAYADAGIKRGEHMLKLYGNLYSCGMRSRGNSITAEDCAGEAFFKHKLTPFKVGVIVYDIEPIKKKMSELLKKYAKSNPDKVIIKEKRLKHGTS